MGARLIDAEGCTSHPGAGKAQKLNLTTQTRLLFQILSCSKRQHAAVLLPEKQEATAELSIVYNKIIIFSSESEAEGPHRHQDAAQTAGSWLVGFSMWRNSLREMGELKVLPGKHRGSVPLTVGRLCDPWAVTADSTPGASHCRNTQNPRIALEKFSTAEQKGSGVAHSACPSHSETGKNGVPLLGFWCPTRAAAHRHGHRAGMQRTCVCGC